jgi:integrase
MTEPPKKLSKAEIRKRKREGRYHDGARALTTKIIARLKPGRYRDGLWSGFGLYLQVVKTKTGRISRSWLLRYQHAERERWMGLGPLSVFSLAEARKRAQTARQRLADGIDPLAAKQQAKANAKLAAQKTLTFRAAARRYAVQHEAKWTNPKHRAAFLRSLEAHVFPILGDMDVATIDTADVLRCLEPIWATKSVTADRTRGRVEAVIDWATVRGHRPPGTNPAKWRGHLDQALPPARKIAPVKHHAAIDYKEVAAFMASIEESIAGQALRFLILCASRTAEVLGAKWSEVDFDNATWTVPAGRMKGKREHRVPLSPQSLDLLKALPRENGSPFVFIGSKPGQAIGRTAFAGVMDRAGRSETVHGFRSAFRTWASEQTNYPREICEQALAHVVGSPTERSYDRTDLLIKRQKLMTAWAKFCAAPARAKGDVVPIGGAR